MRKIAFLYLFLFLSCSVLAQSDSSNWKLKINDCRLSNGYIYQKEHLYEVGFKVDYINENKRFHTAENISLILGGQITRHNKTTYLNPFGTIRYLGPFSKRIGGVLALSYSYGKELSQRLNTLTPELGININGVATISYGYNVCLDERFEYISKHRMAIRLMLF